MIFGLQDWLFWLILAALFLFIELITTLLVSIWFVGGSLLAAATASLGVPTWLQIIVFIISSLIFMLIGWKNRDRLMMQKHKTPTNADRIIGQTGILEADIDPISGSGRVLVAGQSWRAETKNRQNLVKGSKVRIISIEGTRAIVEQISD